MHKGFSMGKNYVFALLIMGYTINIFGAASSSSSGRDETKLRLLARDNAGFVVDLVEHLKSDQRDDFLKPKSLIIFGSPRNGKKSLAREIADQSGRTKDEHRIRSISGLEQFVEDQACKKSPHVSLLKNIHIFQETSVLEDCMDDLRENKQVFLIAVANNTFKRNDALRLFDFEIELNDPDLRARRQILESCLVKKQESDALLGYFATETERLSSGKLHLLAEQLQRVEASDFTREKFDELMIHIARASMEPRFSLIDWSYKNKGALVDITCLIAMLAWTQCFATDERKDTFEYKIEKIRLIVGIVSAGLKIGLNNL